MIIISYICNIYTCDIIHTLNYNLVNKILCIVYITNNNITYIHLNHICYNDLVYDILYYMNYGLN